MSTSLYWLPPPSEVKENSVGWIKHEVARHLSEDWNGLSDDFGLVGPEIIPFLQGIKAVGSKEQASDAQELISAIQKYGKVELYIH